jgi:flagellar FliL protein
MMQIAGGMETAQAKTSICARFPALFDASTPRFFPDNEPNRTGSTEGNHMATAPKAAQKAPAKGAPESAEPSAAAPKKSGMKKLVILLIALLAAGGGGAAWYFLGQKSHAQTAGHKPVEPSGPPVFLVVDPFTVNLQPDGAGDQYLQVAFSLQVASEKDVESIKLYLPQMRSRLLLLLSGKKASEISTVEGKKKLAGEILEQVKQPFTPGGAPQKVTNVFFTSFVIQ